MKKLSVSMLFVAVFAFALSAKAAVPQCVLGGPTAMNPSRQLNEGEYFVFTERPTVVNLQFKPTAEHPEQVGECMIPTGTKVAAKDGIMQWAAECGNNEVGRNIPVGPQPSRKGMKGDKGDPGRDAIPCSAVDNHDGTVSVVCPDGTIGILHDGKDGKNFHFSKKAKVGAGVALAAGAGLVIRNNICWFIRNFHR